MGNVHLWRIHLEVHALGVSSIFFQVTLFDGWCVLPQEGALTEVKRSPNTTQWSSRNGNGGQAKTRVQCFMSLGIHFTRLCFKMPTNLGMFLRPLNLIEVVWSLAIICNCHGVFFCSMQRDCKSLCLWDSPVRPNCVIPCSFYWCPKWGPLHMFRTFLCMWYSLCKLLIRNRWSVCVEESRFPCKWAHACNPGLSQLTMAYDLSLLNRSVTLLCTWTQRSPLFRIMSGQKRMNMRP